MILGRYTELDFGDCRHISTMLCPLRSSQNTAINLSAWNNIVIAVFVIACCVVLLKYCAIMPLSVEIL